MCKIPAVNECTDMKTETKQTKKVSKEEGQDIRGHSAFYLTWHTHTYIYSPQSLTVRSYLGFKDWI